MQTIKTIFKKIGSAIMWLFTKLNEWGTILTSGLALVCLFKGLYLQCYALVGFAILYALWDIERKYKPHPGGIKLKYWVKLRKQCLDMAIESIDTDRLSQRINPEVQVVKAADMYFNYMLSGRIPLTEEEKTKLNQKEQNKFHIMYLANKYETISEYKTYTCETEEEAKNMFAAEFPSGNIVEITQ